MADLHLPEADYQAVVTRLESLFNLLYLAERSEGERLQEVLGSVRNHFEALAILLVPRQSDSDELYADEDEGALKQECFAEEGGPCPTGEVE